MNLLVINLDKNIFSGNSRSLARLKEYSNLVDKIFVIVWTLKKEKPIKYNNKLFIYPTGSKFKWKYYLDTIKIFRKIKKGNKIDLIFTQDPFETGLAGWILAKIFKIPLQLQIHTEFSSFFFRKESLSNKTRFALAKFLIPKADCLRTVSRRFKRELIENYGIEEGRITAVPIFSDVGCRMSDVGNLVAEGKDSGRKFIFLTVGRLVPVKNIEMQIKAFKNLEFRIENLELWIVGDGHERKNYESLIKNYELNSKVKLFGWQDDLEKFYGQADVFLLTSNYEGWGMVIVEAASYGLPIIMTDVGCAGEVIKNEESGIVIPVGDQKKLEESMIRLIKDEKLKNRLRENAARAVLKLPSKKETLELYRSSWLKALKK